MGLLINPYMVAPAGTPFTNTYSVEFDGVDNYVYSADSMSALGFGSTNVFSVSFWVKCNSPSATNWEGFIGATTANGWDDGFGFWYQNNILKFFVGYYTKNAQVAYAGTTTARNWNHIVGVYDGTLGTANIKLYINASVGGTTFNETANLTGTGNPLRIGKMDGTTCCFVGANFDEVALFSTALSSSDITAIYNSGTPESLAAYNPVVWYRMGDGDVYPLLNNQQAYSHRSVYFDGGTAYVDLGDTLDYGTFTISAWVKADALSASLWEGIIAKRGASNPTKQFNLSLDPANEFYFWIYQSDGTLIDVYSDSGIVIDTWYHVLAVADGSILKLYVNGTLQTDTQSYDGTFQDSGSTTKIGENETHMWTGNIDEVAYWNSDQSGNKDTIYNGGTPDDISSLSPLSWWRMGEGDTYPTLTDSGSGGNDGTMTNMSADDITGAQTTGIMDSMVSGDIVADVP